MKKLDAYIIKSFLKPFLATFFVILFVMIILTLWQALEKISGKGVGVLYILKFLYYTTLIVIPLTLPIAVLLASIMSLGTLSENYEFAAIKSAGVSFKRFIAPLVAIAITISILNYVFLDYVFPYAQLKQRNLYINIKKKQPALALVPGSFNNEIPGYSIKFDEKYGEEQNLLKNVIIYNLKGNKGNKTIIKAARGKINSESESSSRYITFELYDGYYYQDHINSKTNFKKRKRVPFSKASFDKYIVNIDVSSFSNEGLDKESQKTSHLMLNLSQLVKKSDTLSMDYHDYLVNKSKNIYIRSQAKELYKKPDSLINKKISLPILGNFNDKSKLNILTASVNSIKRSVDNIKNIKNGYKWKRETLNKYDMEPHRRISTAFAPLVLFLIGASLGSLIKKGGFGLPMIIAIIIYVTYFFISDFAKNLAEASTITPVVGGWASTLLFLPLGLYLIHRATKDMGIINIDTFTAATKKVFGTILKKKKKVQHASND